jgi:hypothetical protein
MNNQLVLEPRWGLVAILCGLVFIGRLALSVLVGADHPPVKAVEPGALSRFARQFQAWGMPLGLGFIAAYPLMALALTGPAGSLKWIDNYGIQILIYIMLGWGLNIVSASPACSIWAMSPSTRWAPMPMRCSPPRSFPRPSAWAFWICLPLAGLLAALLGHHSRLSGAAAARRLSGHRDAGFRRDHPPRADQLGRFLQRLCGDFLHPAATLFRHPLQCQRDGVCRRVRAGIQPHLSHDLSVITSSWRWRC